MSLQLYLIFVAAVALLIATPGPNVALIVGTSLTHGMRTGLMAVAGVNVGVMIQLAVVAAGLAWIVEMFSRNFDLIRFVGAAYLLFLGIQTLWKSRRPTPTRPLSSERAFARGFAVAFANPKTLSIAVKAVEPIPAAAFIRVSEGDEEALSLIKKSITVDASANQ